MKDSTFIVRYANWVVSHPWITILASLLLVMAAASGGKNLAFKTDYRVFFSADNPQLLAFEEIEASYTKNENVMFILEPKSGDAFDEQQFLETNPRILANKSKLDDIKGRLYPAMDNDDMAAIKTLIEDLGIAFPISGSKTWTDVRQFNLMFSTNIGSTAEGSTKIFLRPETAQGIFVNYLNVQKTSRMKIPFGIAQTGKAFRNEIVARQFIFRMREFEQMEMQFFVKQRTQKEWYSTCKEIRLKWNLSLGM